MSVITGDEERSVIQGEAAKNSGGVDAESPRPAHESVRDFILEESRKGNVVFKGLEGLMVAPLEEFIKQPADGILYDLNRLPEVVLTFIDDPKWINDFAVSMVIQRLREQVGNGWIDPREQKPPMRRFVSGQGWQPSKPPYVLAVDVKDRMSVGYASEHSGEREGYSWTFAKPIGEPTHWMPLPDPPELDASEHMGQQRSQ